MTSPRKHLTYANVVATLALIVAVAGIPSAVAITSKLKKNSVGTKQIKKGAITAAKLADGSVTAPKLGPVHRVTQTTPSTGSLVRCNPPERLLSGGAVALGGFLTRSAPETDLTQWAYSGSGTLVGYALCLKASPGG
jgi:hypothetical protein